MEEVDPASVQPLIGQLNSLHPQMGRLGVGQKMDSSLVEPRVNPVLAFQSLPPAGVVPVESKMKTKHSDGDRQLVR